MIKQIPNIITSLNILCGSIAVIFAVSGDLVTTSFFVFLGIFFDFFDGLAARLLNAQSEVGLQLDSLADVITSGVVPGIVMVQLLSESVLGMPLSVTDLFSGEGWNVGISHYLPYIGLIIIIASAYRLAKFNVDTRQTSSFIGLPTPGNTILILSIPLILYFQPSEIAETIFLNMWVLLGITVLSCILLNAELPLFALKFKTWNFKDNAIRYMFLLISLVGLIFFNFIAIPFIIFFYILLSLIWKEKK